MKERKYRTVNKTKKQVKLTKITEFLLPEIRNTVKMEISVQ